MKAFKKQFGRIQSRIASRDLSPVPAEHSDMLDMQTTLALETQHIDSETGEVLVSGPVSLSSHALTTRAFPTCRRMLRISPTSLACNTLTKISGRNLDDSEFSSSVGRMPERRPSFSESATQRNIQRSTMIEGKKYGLLSRNIC